MTHSMKPMLLSEIDMFPAHCRMKYSTTVMKSIMMMTGKYHHRLWTWMIFNMSAILTDVIRCSTISVIRLMGPEYMKSVFSSRSISPMPVSI